MMGAILSISTRKSQAVLRGPSPVHLRAELAGGGVRVGFVVAGVLLFEIC